MKKDKNKKVLKKAIKFRLDFLDDRYMDKNEKKEYKILKSYLKAFKIIKSTPRRS